MSDSPTPVQDVIIIGSGPAGYTAAVYAARAQLSPLVFEGTSFGGALMTTTEVENYPGFREGIMGPALMEEMREQALRFGADLRMEDVEAVSLDGPIKTVTVDGETHQARAVILAMGAAARHLGAPGEQELIGQGVSTCATCDGFFFRDQDITDSQHAALARRFGDLEDHPLAASTQGEPWMGSVFVRREHQHRRGRPPLADRQRGLQTLGGVGGRHPDVDDGDLWPGVGDDAQKLLGIGGLTDDVLMRVMDAISAFPSYRCPDHKAPDSKSWRRRCSRRASSSCRPPSFSTRVGRRLLTRTRNENGLSRVSITS